MSGMTRYWQRWALGKLLVLGGAIGFSGNCAFAQSNIVPDNSLGAQSSVVTPNVDINGITSDRIDGGATRSANLFHSFQEFNIDSGRGAYFTNPAGIENIFSRVTGGNRSEIFGKLGVLGNANLFLINPSGIIFGNNASLDVKGSFVGTTASAIAFGNSSFFSATNPNNPELLTVNPSAFFFNQIAAAPIQNNSVTPARLPSESFNTLGLRVPDGRSLLLLGGNVSVDGGRINAFGGRVELGGLASEGTVGVQVDGNNLSLSFPENVKRADVSLTNGARVRVDATGGGSIAVNARNLDILGGSVLIAGIRQGLGSVGSVAGDITLNATEAIRVRQLSNIQNAVGSYATGNSGNLILTTGSIFVTDGSQLIASTFGQGNAGGVFINARQRIFFDGGDALSTVEKTGRGKGGDIRITTESLSLTNGSQLQTSTDGQGDAGNIIINAGERVSFDGTPSNGYISGAFSTVNETGIGKGGDIRITTGSLSLTNGSQLLASTNGQGDAGNVIIDARDHVFFSDVSFVSGTLFASGAFSTVNETGIGKGGDIRITTGSLSLTNGSQLQTSTDGQGDAGNVIIDARDRVSLDGNKTAALSSVEENAGGQGGDIRITTRELSLTNGAQLVAGSFGQGNAGNVIINVRDRVSFDGTSSDGIYASGALSRLDENARGQGGDIRITTRELSLTNGAQLFANTLGYGDAGIVNINARDLVSLDGNETAVFSSVEETGIGKGGGIRITTDSLSLTNGAQLIAATRGQGDAGSVDINARDRVLLDGTTSDGIFPSAVSSTVEFGAVGNGGRINIITTGSLYLTNGGVLTASSFGEGRAGDVEVQAGSIRLDRGAIESGTASGNGGNITLSVQDILLLRRGSNISATAGTDLKGGDGGNITINAPNGFVVAVPGENSDITANAFSGSGGQVTINATSIFGIAPLSRQELERLRPNDLDPRQLTTNDITAISQISPNLSGTVTINTPDVDPNRGLVNLPTVPLDTQVSQVCQPRTPENQSSFIITGRGGLPPNPRTEPLSGDAVQVDWVTLKPRGEKRTSTNVSKKATSPTPAPIVEAQGWVRNAKGEVVLTAYAPTATPHSSWLTAASCP